MAAKYEECKEHDECRHVRGTGGMFEQVECPWCGYLVSTSNPYNWCAGCYVIFTVDKRRSRVHFNKSAQKTRAQVWAIAIAKSGGARIGPEIKDED